MITDERAAGTARGDHYAKPGDNERVWNAFEKLAVRAPEGFVDYYSNDMVAWPHRRARTGVPLTSQVNVVNPGRCLPRSLSPRLSPRVDDGRAQPSGIRANVHHRSVRFTL